MAHRHSIVEAEGEFREFQETVLETRKAWVDRVWTYYMRRQDYVDAFCGCNTCKDIIAKYYGHGKTIEDVRSTSKIALDRYKAVVFDTILDLSIDDEEVKRICDSATRAEPMSDTRSYLASMMRMESSVHTDDRDIDPLARPRR
jgi:hypothetical protein